MEVSYRTAKAVQLPVSQTWTRSLAVTEVMISAGLKSLRTVGTNKTIP
jgi:hypothetical protein